jgi:hypothetical protein
MRSHERHSNLGASVTARLLEQARRNSDDYQVLLTRYCLERFLYRLGVSEHRARFVLKGAMLLGVWSDRPYRATFDLDLLRCGTGTFGTIRADLRDIVNTPVPPDAVGFAARDLRIEPIQGQVEYVGARATLPANCGRARLRLQIDIGTGDAVWPAPESCAYPTLLDLPAPDLLVYPREAVVAEKLEAIVVLGDRNSRIKDYFDLHHLARHFEFDRLTLSEAIRRTFARRGTPIPQGPPIGLTHVYWENPSRPPQVRAFARRARLDVAASFPEECTRLLKEFLGPLLEDLVRGEARTGTWSPSGHWERGGSPPHEA